MPLSGDRPHPLTRQQFAWVKRLRAKKKKWKERRGRGSFGVLVRMREVVFCAEYFERLLEAGLLVSVEEKKEMATASAAIAGYRKAKHAATRLLKLPRIQEAMLEEFDSVGFGMKDWAKIIKSIAKGEADPRARLAAVDMAIKLTTGYAPTKSANMHAVNVTASDDKLFSSESFAAAPKPVATIIEQD